MTKKQELVNAQLDKIELEMKRIKYWLTDKTQGVGTFEHWLQFSFLPSARDAALKNIFPTNSQVGLMALRQYDYHSTIEIAHPLMYLLFDFDKIIENQTTD